MAAESEETVHEGLDGVLACDSSICFIDGSEGILLYRGYNFRDLVLDAGFLAVVLLLWHGDWPQSDELAEFEEVVRDRRCLGSHVAGILESVVDGANPMAVMRTALSAEGALAPKADDTSPQAILDHATTLVARTPTIVAAMSRLSRGEDPVSPRPDLDHADNFLYMLNGELPSSVEAAAMNILLNTYAEHELNASTFTARTTVGTLSDYYSAVVAATSTLKGALHGGAIDDSMALFREIGDPARVGDFLDEALSLKRKIPGFGHRVYRARDPRAYAVSDLSADLGVAAEELEWHQVAVAVEQELLERKGLHVNVDYYSALVLYHLGFPLDLFTSFIVTSRIAGWTAHIQEQFAANRLIRPRARYVGSASLPYFGQPGA